MVFYQAAATNRNVHLKDMELGMKIFYFIRYVKIIADDILM